MSRELLSIEITLSSPTVPLCLNAFSRMIIRLAERYNVELYRNGKNLFIRMVKAYSPDRPLEVKAQVFPDCLRFEMEIEPCERQKKQYVKDLYEVASQVAGEVGLKMSLTITQIKVRTLGRKVLDYTR